MSNDLTTLTYAEGIDLRTAQVGGETIVCLADLAHGLGIKNVSQLKDRLPDGVWQTYPITDRYGRVQNATFVSEAGMNMVIWRSDKPEAVAYAQWCAERIAELRRHGVTATPALSGKELLAAAVLEAAETIKQHEATIASQRAELEAARPKADTWDAIVSGKGDYTITDAAKVLARAGVQTGPRKLHTQLEELGWLYRNQRGKWTAKQVRLNDGCLAEKVRYYIDDDGVSTLAAPQVRVTAKGLEKLRGLLAGSADALPVLPESATLG